MKYLFTLLAIFIAQITFSQTSNQELKPIAREINTRQLNQEVFSQSSDLFTLAHGPFNTNAREQLEESSILQIRPAALRELLTRKNPNVRLAIPTIHGNLNLILNEVDIYSEGFSIATADGTDYTERKGKHYRGMIDGDHTSLAAISIFDNEVMGLIVNKEGNHVLGQINNEKASYVFYNDRNLRGYKPAKCGTQDTALPQARTERQHTNGRTEATFCVKAYWEADFDLYQNKGSVTQVVNYLTGLFNQSKIIFDNDGINVMLKKIFVWNIPSPYSGNTTAKLDQFRAYRTSFNGDFAHLIHLNGGGGLAYVDKLCVDGWNYAVSGIETSYSNCPTYSYSVMVVTHEQGHVFGSQHTHACAWNGNNSAIDSCQPTDNGCGSLDGAEPAGGGTVMSYCYLVNAGTNLSKGFGPQPKQRIIDAINSKVCLGRAPAANNPITINSEAPVSHYGIYQITSAYSGQALDIGSYSTANGVSVVQWSVTGYASQQWRAISVYGGYWKFINMYSGKVLEVIGNDNAYGSKIRQWDGLDDSYTYQHWKVLISGNGYYYLQNRGSGLILGVTDYSMYSGASVVQWSLYYGSNQQWKFDFIPSDVNASPEENHHKISLAPNPAVQDVHVVFHAQEDHTAAIHLFDIKGTNIHTFSMEAQKGRNEYMMAFPAALTSGLYIVEVDGTRAKLIVK